MRRRSSVHQFFHYSTKHSVSHPRDLARLRFPRSSKALDASLSGFMGQRTCELGFLIVDDRINGELRPPLNLSGQLMPMSDLFHKDVPRHFYKPPNSC
jgi:hypothetical protein